MQHQQQRVVTYAAPMIQSYPVTQPPPVQTTTTFYPQQPQYTTVVVHNNAVAGDGGVVRVLHCPFYFVACCFVAMNRSHWVETAGICGRTWPLGCCLAFTRHTDFALSLACWCVVLSTHLVLRPRCSDHRILLLPCLVGRLLWYVLFVNTLCSIACGLLCAALACCHTKMFTARAALALPRVFFARPRAQP